MDNPYKAPTTPMKDVLPPPRSPILAVLAGVAVDIGGTLATTTVIGLVFLAMIAPQGGSPEEIRQALVDADPLSGYVAWGTVVGFGFSVLGGYVCARVARRQERRLAAIAGLIIGAIGLCIGGSPLGIWANVGMSVVSFAAVMLGGELGRRRNLADARAAGVATEA